MPFHSSQAIISNIGIKTGDRVRMRKKRDENRIVEWKCTTKCWLFASLFFWYRLTLGIFVTAFNVFLNGSMARWLNMFDVLMCLSLQHSKSIDFNIIYICPVFFCVSANIWRVKKEKQHKNNITKKNKTKLKGVSTQFTQLFVFHYQFAWFVRSFIHSLRHQYKSMQAMMCPQLNARTWRTMKFAYL